ncbi:TPA: alpha-ketoacid dehydrogenase subunit beta [archaeon]|uniref:Alpha-ketoacid dehydrogenase subunit beta n=1 Tax=Candidatus Naiadarchaeum limnaeum TaxID=2756139 RepID=A0A832UZJ5_9ARCH|nr:alpha-ketoacid dehydrogenase subunit beta [Candidatus Naiadarchaeales archaeon SRR2090153.bin1042]HIK00199.1 alpha-ketoacid dehydrogenase subunit beta [Candidatus Naiadarchaeum limnaeum]
MEKRQLTYAQAINEALDLCMKKDPSVFIIGEGVPDPKGIFWTTKGLKEKYGPERVLDSPLSENAITGVCIGAALTKMRPIMTHQRVDFSLLAFDQIINNAAKWHYMFGGQSNVPLVIRMMIGKGWGQGAQHSQSLQAIFAHIPGLKVVMPSTPYDAKGLLISSIEDNNPVIFIEHRWLHNIYGEVPNGIYRVPIGEPKIVKDGNDLTIVSSSYMTIETLRAVEILGKLGINAEVIDMRTLKPLNDNLIVKSVEKTGRLLAADLGWGSVGFASEIISRVAEKAFHSLKQSPQKITLPDYPTPTTQGLTKYYYPRYVDIARKAVRMLGKDEKKLEDLLVAEKEDAPLDVPDKSFTGPF